MGNHLIRILATGILAVLVSMAHAQEMVPKFQPGGIYKWKDGQGNIYYTQSPPMGIKYERVGTARVMELATEAGTGDEDAATGEGEGTKDSQPDEMTEEQKQMVANPRFVSNCDIAQKNLKMLQDPAKQFNAVGPDGAPMDAEEWRARQIEITQQNIRIHCQ